MCYMSRRLLAAGGSVYTTRNQGGGSKKQGLVSTKNLPIDGAAVSSLRTRADGGPGRHQVFCMNQLGGVGRRWGQAGGPGNRSGVSVACSTQALESQLAHPVPSYANGISLAGLVLKYTYLRTAGTYTKVAGKTAIVRFEDAYRWTAWFASAPSTIFRGTYSAQRRGQLRIHIVHSGVTADGSQSYIFLTPPRGPPYGRGTFVETLLAAPRRSNGSGPYIMYRPQ